MTATLRKGKKRAVFLSVVGLATYKLLRNLVSPVKPGEKCYQELAGPGSDSMLQPDSIETVQWFKFQSRLRKLGESVNTFVVELHLLAKFCISRRHRMICSEIELFVE